MQGEEQAPTALIVALSPEAQDLADELVRKLGVLERGRVELEVEDGLVATAWTHQRLRRSPERLREKR